MKKKGGSMNMKNKKKGFTLAEVLITLTIIGVVAAITVPVLLNSENEKANITAFKKVYSELAQTSSLLNAENGGDWTVKCSTWDNLCMRDVFAEKLNYIKKCDNGVNDKCSALSKFKDGSTAVHNTATGSGLPSLVTASGFSIGFRMHYQNCMENTMTNCGWSWIDTNGLKGPNTIGKDIFLISYGKDGSIIPLKYGDTLEEWKTDCDTTGYSCGAVYMVENK